MVITSVKIVLTRLNKHENVDKMVLEVTYSNLFTYTYVLLSEYLSAVMAIRAHKYQNLRFVVYYFRKKTPYIA